MTAPIVDPSAPLGDAHMAEQKRIACLAVARVQSHSPSDQLAYAFDVRLIETHADVATDDSYPGWAEHIAALQAANPRQTARKEGNR